MILRFVSSGPLVALPFFSSPLLSCSSSVPFSLLSTTLKPGSEFAAHVSGTCFRTSSLLILPPPHISLSTTYCSLLQHPPPHPSAGFPLRRIGELPYVIHVCQGNMARYAQGLSFHIPFAIPRSPSTNHHHHLKHLKQLQPSCMG